MRYATLWAAWLLPLSGVLIIVASETGLFKLGTLKEWQSLIGASFAIIAAAIGASVVVHQTRTTERLQRELRRGRFLAERAQLPLALNEVAKYAKCAAKALDEIYGQRTGNTIPTAAVIPAFPMLPTTGIERFAKVIETADCDQVRTQLALLLQRLQVQSARMLGLIDQIPDPTHLVHIINIESYIIDAAEVYARVSDLYDYAREENDLPKDTWGRRAASTALNLMEIRDITHPRVHLHVSWMIKP